MKTKNGKQPKVVTIGGGTGQSVLLRGLKTYPIRLTAVVSMADDGGSGGALRDELGVLPPGDVRMCLVALSSAPETLRTLFQYRFADGNIKGHTLGNMFLSALEKTTGSFSEAVATAGKILEVYGRVIPVSEEDMRLLVTLQDGTVLCGEQYLNDNEEVREKGVRNVSLENSAHATPATLQALEQADCIVIGPGGLYDSLLPPLLVEGVSRAICDSRARVVYVANLTNKKGQTDGFSLKNYVDTIHVQLGQSRIDTVICNNATPDADVLARYTAQEGERALVACEKGEGDAFTLVHADVLGADPPQAETGDAIATSRSLIRHDSDKLARTVIDCIT